MSKTNQSRHRFNCLARCLPGRPAVEFQAHVRSSLTQASHCEVNERTVALHLTVPAGD